MSGWFILGYCNGDGQSFIGIIIVDTRLHSRNPLVRAKPNARYLAGRQCVKALSSDSASL